MIFTAVPITATAEEGSNTITWAEFSPAEMTLFSDAYHLDDKSEIEVTVIGQTDGEVTDFKAVEWRSSAPAVVTITVDEEDSRKAVISAKGVGTASIIANVINTKNEAFQAICSVTVRESIRVPYEALRVIMNEIPADVDDTDPPKYSASSIAQLRKTFQEIQDYFGEAEEMTFAQWKSYLLEKIQAMDDTVDNYQLINTWKRNLMREVASVTNSVLALPDDDEFWGSWREAYSKMPEDLAAYTDATAGEVTDIIDEYRSTEWLDNEDSKRRIDLLAQRLEEAIANLKSHTTYFKFNTYVIEKSYGDTPFRIPYTIEGEDEIEWQSTDEAIVAVNASGQVVIRSAIPAGYTRKIRIIGVSNGITESCEIIIKNPVSVIEVPAKLSLLIGDPKGIDIDLIGADASCPVTETPDFEYSCDDISVATVNSSGVITPVAKGKCKITVSVKGRPEVEPVTIDVTVSQAQKVTKLVPVGGMPTQVTVNATAEAKLYVYPTTATNKEVRWTSSDESVATVTPITTDELSYATAAIRGVRSGTALITYEATDDSGVKGSFSITVNPLVQMIMFDKRTIVAYIGSGEAVKINATCQPVNAGNQKLNWISSNEEVATVVDGKIKLNMTGTCDITAIAQDGSGVSKTATLLVLGSAETMSMSSAPKTMDVGDKFDLDCTVVTRQGVTYQVEDWSVDNEKLASVDENGLVTALYPGKVKVTARYFDGTTVTKTIEIIAPLKGLSLPNTITLSVGKTKTLVPTYKPEYATNKAVKWTSSDSSVASISTAGVITAAGIGTAVIRAVSEEGGYIAVCEVKVIQPATGVTLSKSLYTLIMGKTESVKLTAKVAPANATTKTVTWTTSNKKVATVSTSGIVTAKGPGTATITVKTTDGGYTAKCKITVRQPVKGIKFASSKLTYYVGQKEAVDIIFTPSNATNKGLVFKTSDSKIATISEKGTVTAKKKGTCTLTAVSDDGAFKATCTLKVIAKVDVDDVNITKSSVTINAGKTKQLNAEVYPGDASIQDVIWSSSDKSIASVNSEGVVTAHKGGTVTIKCKSADTSVSDKCKVTVYESVKSVTISATSATLVAGNAKTLTAEVQPSTATNQGIKWYTSDKTIATVTSGGKIKAYKGGTCTITARSVDDNNIKARCKLTVLQPPTKITLSETDIEITKGDSAALVATVSPKNSFDKTVKWKSSDSTVAKVSETGVVKGVSAGTAVITCTSTVDPSVKRICNVTVYQPVTGVSLSAEKLTLTTGRTKTLVATVEPAKASNKKVTFKTSNKDVVRVSSKGVLDAVGPGQATITVRTEDGFYTAKCQVTVIEPVVGVSLDRKSTTIAIGKTKTLIETVRPSKASNKDVIWRSSNPLVARVSQSGVVTALSEGTATITVTTEDGGFTASCKVNCIYPVEAVEITKTSVTISKGSTKTLKAVVYPDIATNQKVTWKSSDKAIATVDENGKVKALKKGSCIITCTTVQGEKKATCIVTVN